MNAIKIIILVVLSLMSSLYGYSQIDSKPTVGIPAFTSEVDSKYNAAVTEKVVQMVTNTRRFNVLDRTSYDKAQEELKFQRSEAFMDSKNKAEQGEAVGAQYLIAGHIIKTNVYSMKNPDGSINGYKASTAFNLKMTNVETGVTSEATDFQTKVSPLCLSPETAMNEALKSIEPALNDYFAKTFPLTTKIVKILNSKKNKATEVLISGGKSFGFKEGNELIVERIELLDGKPYPTKIGELEITKVAGEFSECEVSDGEEEIFSLFNAAEKINCTLVVE